MSQVASTGEFWSHDAREGLKAALLFAQWLPLLFLFAPIPPCIFPARAVRMYCPHSLHNPAWNGLLIGMNCFLNVPSDKIDSAALLFLQHLPV